MTDNTELKRLAEAAAKHGWYQAGAFGLSRITGEAEESFVVAASPAAVLLLIADNERLKNRLEVDPRHDYDGISTRDATVKVLDEQVDQLKADNERLEVEVKRMTSIAYAAHGAFRMETMAERDQLRAEVAGLRTGYEAYERVNAELKAENEALRRERDARHPFKPFHEPAIGFTGCVICGVYTDHGGLPCPKTRATADAALGQGEKS